MSEMYVRSDPRTGGLTVTTRIDTLGLEAHQRTAMEYAIRLIAKDIAERFLADHAQDILKMLDPQAIANLAIADSAAGVREALHKKLPDKIVEVVRRDTEVWQRGIFGGMKRIG